MRTLGIYDTITKAERATRKYFHIRLPETATKMRILFLIKLKSYPHIFPIQYANCILQLINSDTTLLNAHIELATPQKQPNCITSRYRSAVFT